MQISRKYFTHYKLVINLCFIEVLTGKPSKGSFQILVYASVESKNIGFGGPATKNGQVITKH